MTVVYHCPDVVARYQTIEQLMEFSDKTVTHLSISRTRDGFDILTDEVSNAVHAQIQSRVRNISWEVIEGA